MVLFYVTFDLFMMATHVEVVTKVESEPGSKTYSVRRTQPPLRT